MQRFSPECLRRMLAYRERLDRPVPTEQSIALDADWDRSKETEVLPLAASNKYYVVSQVESYYTFERAIVLSSRNPGGWRLLTHRIDLLD